MLRIIKHYYDNSMLQYCTIISFMAPESRFCYLQAPVTPVFFSLSSHLISEHLCISSTLDRLQNRSHRPATRNIVMMLFVEALLGPGWVLCIGDVFICLLDSVFLLCLVFLLLARVFVLIDCAMI